MTRHWAPWLSVALLVVAGIGPSRAASAPPEVFRNLPFRNIGPAIAGGRVSSVTGVPGKPNVIYVGAAAGGVWKTTTGGNQWKPIFEDMPTSSIGVVTLNPAAPNELWVGTGEPNIRNDVIDGAGVFYSPDGGKTWQDMGLDKAGQIGAVVIDTADPKTVFVAALGNIWRPTADRGIYRTTNGGKTWKKVLYVDENTGGIDIQQVPGHPNVLFAAMWQVRRFPWKLDSGGPGSGLYRSTDGGSTWQKLTRGLPTGPVGRIGIAVAPSNPEHVYALIGSRQGVLWESNDMGDSWHLVSNDHALNERPFYFSMIEVAPDDENRVYFGGVRLRESEDGGRTSHIIDQGVHVDHHALWIDPTNPDFMVQGNDGGVYSSPDRGKTWRFLDNLPIGQFYALAIGNTFPFTICGGMQDNGGWCGPSSDYVNKHVTGIGWQRFVGGDGQYTVPAWSEPSVIYAASQRGNISRHDAAAGTSRYIRPTIKQVLETPVADLKYRFNWTAPIAVSRTDPGTVYLGANVVFKTTDGGEHWGAISGDLTRNDKSKQEMSGGSIYKDNSGAETYGTILAISVAPGHPDVIWVGTDDGRVHVTRDGGGHWRNVTPPDAREWARIPQIGVSPFDPGTAYVAVDGHKLGDRAPHAWRTRDFGKTWVSITDGVSGNAPVRVVREDPNRQGLLVMGTGTSVYYSDDAGDHWSRFENFPTVPVLDLRFVPDADSLAIATHGRGLFVLDNLLPLEAMTAKKVRRDFVLLPAKHGTLVHGAVATPTYGSDTYSVPNAPAGATLSYFLGADAPATDDGKAKVQITVTDAAGNTVATRSTTGTPGAVNEYVWNLRYDGPTRLSAEKANPNGPRVVAGTYQVAVAVGQRRQTQSVRVIPDPRAPLDQTEAHQRLQAALELRNELSALNEMLNRIIDMRSALGEARTRSAEESDRGSGSSALAREGQALDAKLVRLQDSVYNPAQQHNVALDRVHYLLDFRARLTSLLRLASRNAGRMTTAAVQRAATETRGELQRHLARFNEVLETDVAAYNATAKAAEASVLNGGGPIHVAPAPSGSP